MIGSKRIDFSIELNWLVAIGVVAVGLIVAFIVQPTWRPVLLFVAPVLGGSAALIAAFNALETRQVQSDQAAKSALATRRATSMNFVHAWMNPAFFHAKKNGRLLLKEFQSNPTAQQQKQYLDTNPDHQANLFDLLNMFEALGLAVRCEVCDEELLKGYFRSVLIEYWHAAEGYIKMRRAERQNARLLQEMEWLFGRWKD